ncbi:hypothetical protein Nepgr_024019 [Nepenthes gracilis]|uniref:Uncharacterized protein n=1 Tax=Nepenthes gracilis TaxID=150966 RepID=A0AAD3T5D8_NEPGR|nr:hypothetical protein Nepgr_024019 [Nepenthes gracilis]
MPSPRHSLGSQPPISLLAPSISALVSSPPLSPPDPSLSSPQPSLLFPPLQRVDPSPTLAPDESFLVRVKPLDYPSNLLVANGAMDVSEPAASPKGFGSAPLSSRGAQLPSIIRLKSDADIATPSVDIVVSYHGKPVQPVKDRSAILGSKSFVVNSVSPSLNDVSCINSSAEELRVPVGVVQELQEGQLLPGDDVGAVDNVIAVEDAPTSKVVQFAPEIMSTVAPSCASRSRKMAPCSDIFHLIVYRIPYLGLKDSVMTPPGGAHGSAVVNPLSISDVDSVCHYDAPDEVVAPSTTRGVAKGLDFRALEDSQPPLEVAMSSNDALPIPVGSKNQHLLETSKQIIETRHHAIQN